MRPRVPLDSHKEEIAALALEGRSIQAICAFLEETHGVHVTRPTLDRRIREWGLRPPSLAPEAIDELILSLYRLTCNTEEILQILAKKGITLSKRTLGSKR
jgi:hypothetical protein